MPNFPFVTWQEVLGEDFSRLIGNNYLAESEIKIVAEVLSFSDEQIREAMGIAERMASLVPTFDEEYALRTANEVATRSLHDNLDRKIKDLLEKIDTSRRETVQKAINHILQARLKGLYARKIQELDNESKECFSCSVRIGEFHAPGCAFEQCPFCSRQLLGCSCWQTQLGLNPETSGEELTREQEERLEKILREKAIRYGDETEEYLQNE